MPLFQRDPRQYRSDDLPGIKPAPKIRATAAYKLVVPGILGMALPSRLAAFDKDWSMASIMLAVKAAPDLDDRNLTYCSSVLSLADW